MVGAARAVPVAVDQIRIGIEVAEELVRERQLPRVALDLLPVFYDFGAGDDDVFAGSGLVDDSFRVGLAAAGRGNALAIDAFVHGDDVARLGQPGRGRDRAEHVRLGPVSSVVAAHGDMELRRREGGWHKGKGREHGERTCDRNFAVHEIPCLFSNFSSAALRRE